MAASYYDRKGFDVRNAEIEEKLKQLSKRLFSELHGTQLGFTLFLHEYGTNKALFYISSAEREGIIATMKEFIAVLEKQR